MNIRMSSKGIRFRIEQNEVAKLLSDGFLRESIFFSEDNFIFSVEFSDRVEIVSKSNEVVFRISSDERDKLQSGKLFKESLVVVEKIFANGIRVIFKIEIDFFNAKQRELNT